MVNIIDNTNKPKISEAQLQDAKAKAAENVNLRQETVKEDGTTPQQKAVVKTGDQNAKQTASQLEGLTKDNIVLLGDKVLLKVVIETKSSAGIWKGYNEKSDKENKGPIYEYIELYKASPNAQKQISDQYPELADKQNLRCACNIALIQQINCGARMVEEHGRFEYRYYTAPIGQIEFLYDPTVSR